MAEHAGGEVGRDGGGALGGQPSGAGGRTTSDLKHLPTADRAEQPGVGLAEPLRAPDEVDVAEEPAVLGLVGVGVSVPPGPVGGPGLGDGRQPAHGDRRVGVGVLVLTDEEEVIFTRCDVHPNTVGAVMRKNVAVPCW